MSDLDTAGYERRDISPRAVMWFAIGLVVTLIVTFFAIRGFERVLTRAYGAEGPRVLAPHAEVPPPRLQTNPASDLADFRAAEDAKLHSYGWVDRKAGIVHIPIERAMELTVERGLPARAAAKGAAP